MRIFQSSATAVFAVAAFFTGMLAVTSQVAAQGVFSDLFGWLVKPSAPQTQTLERSEDPYQLAPRSAGPRMSYRRSKFRTVCVRLCDGYYFPISNSSSRNRFHSDAEQCQSRCRGDVQLYYMPRGASDISQARDISGKPYKRLDTAFLYRKKYVANCACRPAPWTPEERARHAMYGSPPPQVALDDQVLDKVAAKMDAQTADGDATKEPNPYSDVAVAPRPASPYVARKRPPVRTVSAPKLKAPSKQMASAKRRRNRRINSRGGVQGSGPKFLWPGDGS